MNTYRVMIKNDSSNKSSYAYACTVFAPDQDSAQQTAYDDWKVKQTKRKQIPDFGTCEFLIIKQDDGLESNQSGDEKSKIRFYEKSAAQDLDVSNEAGKNNSLQSKGNLNLGSGFKLFYDLNKMNESGTFALFASGYQMGAGRFTASNPKGSFQSNPSQTSFTYDVNVNVDFSNGFANVDGSAATISNNVSFRKEIGPFW